MTRAGKPKYRCSEADMRAAVLAGWRRHGFERFRLPDGAPGLALSEAQRLGWVWMPRPDCVCITPSGRQAVAGYGGEADAD